jgi:hypothetical protein
MKYLLSLGLGLFLFASNAQQSALTGNGDEVLLYDDGTWEYSNDSLNTADIISVNDKLFEKSKKSSFLVKSKKTNSGIYINPKDWSFTKGVNNADAEYEFQAKGQDIYGMLITEKTPIQVESLVDIAFQNAKGALTQVKRTQIEYRTINGLEVIHMQMEGVISGINIVYFGYYFSNDTGSIQLLTYTSNVLFEDFKEKMEVFLNGLVLLSE